MLVPRLVSSVRRQQPVRLAGAHGLTVNPVYVDDAASAIVKALSVARTTVVNLAGPDVVSLREMSECIARHLGVTPRFETVDEEAPAVVGDIARMTDLLGPPRTRFADAVPRLCEPAEGG
jgi:nucleoside-diphosphate-sugar epimerase